MLKKSFGFAAAALVTLAVVSPANALLFDQNVTNNVIMGGGITNGAFTVDRNQGVELGLRAKLRFDSAGNPQNVFNSNGNGTYTFSAGQAVGGFSSVTPVWNFEWSVNSNFNALTGRALGELSYSIGIDFDPGAGTNFLAFEPIRVTYADHAIGTNATAQGGGTVAPVGDATAYANLLLSNNLAQNSWNIDFFDGAAPYTFDPNAPGDYEIVLQALQFAGGDFILLAETKINVLVEPRLVTVPEPASGLLLLIGLAGFGVLRRRRTAA